MKINKKMVALVMFGVLLLMLSPFISSSVKAVKADREAHDFTSVDDFFKPVNEDYDDTIVYEFIISKMKDGDGEYGAIKNALRSYKIQKDGVYNGLFIDRTSDSHGRFNRIERQFDAARSNIEFIEKLKNDIPNSRNKYTIKYTLTNGASLYGVAEEYVGMLYLELFYVDDEYEYDRDWLLDVIDKKYPHKKMVMIKTKEDSENDIYENNYDMHDSGYSTLRLLDKRDERRNR